MTEFPNREYRNADESARRRALRALDEIEHEIRILRRRIDGGTIDGDDTNILGDRFRQVTQYVSVLGALREVREWDAADQAERAGKEG